MTPLPPYPSTLAPTALIDSDHPAVAAFAARHAVGVDDVERAVALYLAVRDGFRYDPYRIDLSVAGMRASHVIEIGVGWCVPKAALLAAAARAAGIPARVGYADVRNHLSTERMRQTMKTDLFVWHGYTELWLEGQWVKATPAFNSSLCRRHKVPALEFNGREDSLFQPYNFENEKFMEYVKFYGIYADVPVDEIVVAWEKAYGEERIQAWIRRLEEGGDRSLSDFEKEDVLME